MMNRRTILGALAAAFSATAGTRKARASAARAPSQPYDFEPRGSIGKLERLPSLDLESHQDFLTGFRVWSNGPLSRAAQVRAGEIFKAKEVNPESLSLEAIRGMLEGDPVIGASMRYWISGQQISWKLLQDEFHSHADDYLAEMDAADKAGPGTVKLNPDLKVPEYAAHEIHIQPGGYVGDPFAGHIYHYGTNHFYMGHNDQDEVHAQLAAAVEPPEDGKVLRILDLACGPGQLTLALKDRFPDAEVWGLDVSAPMVRYAHMRAADLGRELHFVQELAEATDFPDNYFDLVASYIVFHETPAEITREIVREVHRITRPGGVFQPFDFPSDERPPTGYRRFRRWWDYRWNNEVWRNEFAGIHFPTEIAKSGFTVREAEKGRAVLRPGPRYARRLGARPGEMVHPGTGGFQPSARARCPCSKRVPRTSAPPERGRTLPVPRLPFRCMPAADCSGRRRSGPGVCRRRRRAGGVA